MSIPCPQCQNPIDQEFGIATCPSCGHVFMIDMDAPAEEPKPKIPEVIPENLAPAESLPIIDIQTPESQTPAEVSPPPAVAENLPPIASADDMQSALKEIRDFGNGELATSPISYALKISGIDRQELRSEISEILSDSKLALDGPALMGQIENGTLNIPQLNPVKTSILVDRLSKLTLQLSWVQAIFEPTAQPSAPVTPESDVT